MKRLLWLLLLVGCVEQKPEVVVDTATIDSLPPGDSGVDSMLLLDSIGGPGAGDSADQ
jgi:hypothetical protein